MRGPGAPVRFLIGVVGLWLGVRAAMLSGWWERAAGALPAAPTPCLSCQRRLASIALPRSFAAGNKRDAPRPAPAQWSVAISSRHPGAGRDPPLREPPGREYVTTVDPGLRRDGESMSPPVVPPEPPLGLAAPPRATRSRWSGSAWVFVRGEGASSLAGGGQLGGSQAGARIAYRVDDTGRLALAARAYLPTGHPRGSEAAVGIDLHPLPDIPFRLSVERRIALGRDGRDAWSAYAAGGFFRGLPGSLEVDGYGQAGVVGVRSRDLFADGAVRLARRVALGGGVDLLAGTGAWGAAQPGAARIDVGPHLALRLPAAGTSVAVAAEWRFRVAGDARPGSGPTLTLATDF